MMKRLIMLCLFSVLSSLSLNLIAEQAATTNTKSDVAASPAPAAKNMDNTMNFFIALSGCVPGDYKEKNVMSDQVGLLWLNHTINGMDKDFCNVTLSTPDGRKLDCNFLPEDLAVVVEQHFIIGILSNNYKNPSNESMKSDQIWTDLKSNACGF